MLLRRLYFRALIAAALIVLVLWRAEVWQLPDTLGRTNWLVALAVLFLHLPIIALWALRSHLVLAKLGYRVPLGPLVLVTTLGNVAGALTPVGSGDILRGIALRDRHALEPVSAAAVVLYERLYLMFLLALSAATAVAAQIVIERPWAVLIVLAAGVALAGCGGFLYVLTSAPVRSAIEGIWVKGSTSAGRGRVAWLGDLDEMLGSLFRNARLSLSFSLITGLAYGITAVQVWLLIDDLGAHVSLMEAWTAYAVASLVGMLVMLPAGLGVWDATMPAILSSRGVDLLVATAVTLLLRVLITLPLGLLAAASYLLLMRGGYIAPSKREPVPAPASEYLP